MPYALHDDPKVTVMALLRDEWNHPTVTDFEEADPDFDWVIDGHFETRWIHTGWHDDSNPNPQVTVSTRREDPGSASGWNGIDPTGAGPTAWMDGRVEVDTWVRSDRDYTGGENPKKYAYQLAQRVQLIIGAHADGVGALSQLGTGEEREIPDPEETPIGARIRVPTFYQWHKSPR